MVPTFTLLLDEHGDVPWNFSTACNQIYETAGLDAALSFAYLMGLNENDADKAKSTKDWIGIFEKTAADMDLSVDWNGKQQDLTNQ